MRTPTLGNSYRNGFTLVELVVTLAVAAILVTVAIPGFSNLIRDNRLVASTNLLVTSLALARTEAVKRGSAVSICASSNGASCTGGSWDDGWLVFTDGGTAGTVDGGDTILRVEDGLSGDLVVTVAGDAYATFRATGFAVAHCDAACAGSTWFTESVTTPSNRLLATLLPGGPAHAGPGGGSAQGGGSGPASGGSGGSGSGADNGGVAAGNGAVSQFTLCNSRPNATGRRISLWPSGRFDTTLVSCGG